MLHELLLSLYGNSQYMPDENLLLDPSVSWANEETVAKKKFEEYYPFMHPSEKYIVNEILKIALCYKKIEIFADKYRSCSLLHSNAKPGRLLTGQYLTAFATAIYEETIPYKNKIVSLEEQILKEPNTSLSTLLMSILPFASVFIEFGCLIDNIHNQGLHGCKILELIHFHIISTVGDYHVALMRIEKVVLQVLYNQLANWLIYGELYDRYNELFLKPSPNEDICEDYSSIEEVLKVSNSVSEMDLTADKRSSTEVCLNLEMLPDFIDLDIAEMILFVGESIRFYEKEEKRNKENILLSQSGHVLKKKEEEFLLLFSKLSEEESFCLSKFSELVESIRKYVSERLYTLVTEAGLLVKMRNLKEIYLLGRGELYYSFFTLVEKFVKQPSLSNAKMEFNTLFQKAGRLILLEDDFLENFKLYYVGQSDQHDVGIVWNNFRIDYSVQWPLHKIFNRKIMEKYNIILRFLLNLQWTQYRLQHLWVIQKENKNLNQTGNVELLCWALRHHMSHLIYNFQYYIQVDVLESFYCQLVDDIKATNDYQNLCKAHMGFLSSLVTHCFLSHPFLSSSISAILHQIHLFCSCLENTNNQPSNDEVEKIRDDFDRLSAKFFWGLTVLGQQRSSHYTAQLVTRIDYNHYYSEKSSTKRFLNLDIQRGLNDE